MVPFNGCVAARRSEDDKSINSGHKEHGYTIHHATFNNLSFKRQVHIILATIIKAQYLAMLILPHRDSFHGHSTSPFLAIYWQNVNGCRRPDTLGNTLEMHYWHRRIPNLPVITLEADSTVKDRLAPFPITQES